MATRLDFLGAARRLAKGEQSPPSTLKTRLVKAYEDGDSASIKAALTELHDLQTLARQLAWPPGEENPIFRADVDGIQSTQFMVDLLPRIQQFLATYPRERTFSVIDVGPGTGHGTALLAWLYSRGRLGYRMKVSALDIRPTYQHYLPAITPNVPFIKDDVFDHESRYDIAIASHVIEHIPDPLPFIRRLQELSREAVFIACPFQEPADRLTKGHVIVVDHDLVKQMNPDEYEIVNSVGWGAIHNPPYQMLIARLPGLAPPLTGDGK